MESNIVGRCNGCGNALGMCFCKFKTLHENAVNINPYSIEEQVRLKINKLKNDLAKLPRYENGFGSGFGGDCWSTM